MSVRDPRHAPAQEQPKYQESPEHARKGYETLDAQAGATYRAGFYILGMMFLVALVVAPLYWLLVRRERHEQPPAATVIRQAPAAAAATFPRLVTSEPEVLAAFRRQEDELLNGYGWVEKDRGVVRMPVDEALRLVGARGELPVFPPAAGAASDSAPPAGAQPAGGQPTPAGSRGSARAGGAR